MEDTMTIRAILPTSAAEVAEAEEADSAVEAEVRAGDCCCCYFKGNAFMCVLQNPGNSGFTGLWCCHFGEIA